MSVLGRAMLALWYGLPLDPADAEELGRIFDETPLYGIDPPDEADKGGCAGVVRGTVRGGGMPVSEWERSLRAVDAALRTGPEAIDRLRQDAIEGVIVDGPDFSRLARAMVETTTEFDFDPGREWSLPDDLRERLVQWCADLHAWDRGQR